ncbi:hypothetical protein ACVILH_000871 [Bradyrhizobium sp. USDA 4353]
MGVPTKTAAGVPPPQPSPTRGEGAQRKLTTRSVIQRDNYSTEIGEKSMNQLFGCTTPFTLGLIARGPTSWAT